MSTRDNVVPKLGASLEGGSLALAEAVPLPVLVTDAEGGVVTLNANFRFVFGQHTPLGANTRIEDLVDARHSAVLRAVLARTLEDGGCPEVALPRLDGELQDLELRVAASRVTTTEGAPAVIFVMREVTSSLELSALRDRIEVLGFLFRTLIHDVRSPLAAITNGVEFLKASIPVEFRQSHVEESEEIDEIVGVIHFAGKQIDNLLNDLGDYVEVQDSARNLELTTLSVEDLVTEILDVYRIQQRPHDLVLEASGDSTVVADEPRLSRALDNLISNAMKYSPAGGEVRVTVAPADDPSRISVTIADQGLGIDREYLDKIFEPFYRLHTSDTTDIEGSGLGLSIVHSIIEMHGGTIGVESEVGVGTTFTVLLPRDPA